MKLSFVIPVFNEQDSLRVLCDEIRANCGTDDFEILFVDDGSTDGSFSAMKALAQEDLRIRVLRLRGNFGKAAALQAGFDLARGEIVFTLDADLQDNPSEIPAFLAKLDEGYDLVTGWKRKRNDPIEKVWPSRFFNYVASSTFGLRLHDYNCGFKAYRRELVQELDIYGEMHRYIPALAHARGFRVGEIPVDHRQRQFGKTKYGFKRYLRGFLDLLTVKLVTRFVHSPLYLFGGLGSAFTLLGLAVEAYLTVLKLGFHQPLYNRPLLFLGVLLISVGVQLFSIGLIGELVINRTRDHYRGRSVSVRETINLDSPPTE
jgi:glycosyltransferase involved in cell wall biosynthesis